MKKVTERKTNKIAIFYEDIDYEEIVNLTKNSFDFVTNGTIKGKRVLFVKSGSKSENKYISVAPNNWLVMDAMAVGNNQLLIEKIKVISPEKFTETYEIIENEPDLFSEVEVNVEVDEDKSIKFETKKRKKA